MKNIKIQLILLSVFGILCGLLGSCFNMPYLTYIAYTPLMYGLMFSSGRRQFFYNFCAFFVPYYLTQLSFLLTIYKLIPVNEMLAVLLAFIVYILLTLWEVLLMLMPVYTFLWIKRGDVTDVFSLSVLICMGEWLTENIFLLSFPWSGAWLSVTGSPLLCQPANLFGAFFVSFLILSINGLFVRIVFCKRRFFSVVSIIALLGFVIVYGNYSLDNIRKSTAENDRKIKVTAVQGDAEGSEKDNISSSEFIDEYEKIISENLPDKTNLILLPETAIPVNYNETSDEFIRVSQLANQKKCTIVAGCFGNFEGSDYNSIYAFLPDKTVSEPYFKQVLVPFGEKIPLAWLFGEKTLTECSDKTKLLPLKGKNGKIGAVICIESIYSKIVRSQSENGAEILCVSTNDSWFGKSFARGQHYRHSIMRAVENGKFLVRSGNCGISAVISPAGEQLAVKTDTSKGAVSAEAALISESTVYVKNGGLFSAAGVIVIAAAICRRFGTNKVRK